MVEPNLSSSLPRTAQSLPAGESAVPGIADQLACLLEFLQQPVPEESPAAYRERLAAAAGRISKISQQVQGIESEKLEVIGANASSAACDPSDVAKGAGTITLNYSVFTRLAYDLPVGKPFHVSELTADWVRYQKNGSLPDTGRAITRLMDAGVLESVGANMVQRTARPFTLKNVGELPTPRHYTELQNDTRRLSTERISCDEIARAIRENPTLADTFHHVSHGFGEHQDDQMRLLAVSVLGLSALEAGKLWSPPLPAQRVRAHILRSTGASIDDLRVSVERVLVGDLVELLTAKLSELAYEEAARRSFGARGSPEKEASVDRNAGALIAALATSQGNTEATRLKAQFAFGIADEDITSFVGAVLHHAKEPLVDLLQNSPLASRLTMRRAEKVEIIADCVVEGLSFKAVGEAVGLSRERIRQYQAQIAGLHPLIDAIMSERAPDPAGSQLRFTTELITQLSDEIKRDPRAAHQVGTKIDSSLTQHAHEDPTTYLRRIFLAAFAGVYADGTKNRMYPAPLQHLADGPTQFFRHLACECIDSVLKSSIKNFLLRLSDVEIDQKLASHGIALRETALPPLRAWVRALVDRPTASRAHLLQSVSPRQPHLQSEKVFSLIEPVVRELGKMRAEEACAVFDEPWCAPWLPTDRLLNILSKRVREQLSIAETCSALNMTTPNFSVSWHQLTTAIPTLAHLVPRQARSSRKHNP